MRYVFSCGSELRGRVRAADIEPEAVRRRGAVLVPHFRFVDTDNEWSVENEGVAPDIEVELDPVATNNGTDTQLQAAIEQIEAMLADYEDDIPDEAPPLPIELGQ